MKLLRSIPLGPWEEHLFSQWVSTIMIAVHWGLGLAVLVGGRERFQVPTYQPLLDITGGHVWVWGVSIIIAGALMIVPSRAVNMVGLWIGMVWMIMWTSLFAVSVSTYQQSAATPVVAYAGFALLNASLLTARALEREPTREG